MAEKREELFKPIKIGKVEIKNRLILAPMCTRMGNADGSADEQTMGYLNARAKGGVGLIMSPPIVAAEEWTGKGPKFLYLTTQQQFIQLSRMVEQVHHFGAKIFIHTASGGMRLIKTRCVIPEVDWGLGVPGEREPAASSVPFVEQTEKVWPAKSLADYKKRGVSIPFMYPPPWSPREATIEEIHRWEGYWPMAARRAKVCGFDGIQIHNCHGGPAFGFLSPRLNRRTDEYGGSLENRMRHLLNCLTKTKEEAGDDFPVSVRISMEEHMPGGITFEDTKVVAKELERLGANHLDLDDGCYEAMEYFLPDEDGTLLDKAAEIRKLVKIPVTVCSVHDPDMANKAIREGKTDMISLGRPLLSDPEWPNKVARGVKFVKCTRCNVGCWGRLREGFPIRCVMNPALGFEQYMPEYHPKPPFKETWRIYGTTPIA